MRLRTTPFGMQVEFDVPEGCDMVVLCINTLQHQPVHILLPHQVYLKNLLYHLRLSPGASGFTVLPVRSSEKITLPTGEILAAAKELEQ